MLYDPLAGDPPWWEREATARRPGGGVEHPTPPPRTLDDMLEDLPGWVRELVERKAGE